MRILLVAALLLGSAGPAAAAQAGERVNLLDPNVGLMFWTLLIFVILLFVLKKFAFPPILAAVEAREQALEAALEASRRDREEARQYLEDSKRQVEAARSDAQRMIADGRAVGEKVHADMIEQARVEQQEMLERARREIATETERAVESLRRQATELAIRAAEKVIERNLDDEANRQLVESFLTGLEPQGGAGATGGGRGGRR